jgi:hypothetical protein
MNRRLFVPLYALALLAAIVGVVSCNNTGKKSPNSPASRVEGAPVGLHHWVEHDQLRALMVQIEDARRKTVNTVAAGDAATLHPDAHKGFSAATEAAKRLAIAAKAIPGAVADVPMSDEDREEFKKQAGELRDEARRLSFIARARRADKMQELLTAIQEKCISCHTRFRDIAGEYQPPRV